MPLDQPSRQSASVEERLPYARQWLTEQDIAAVAAVLRGDWLTTGPVVEQFEQEFARAVDAVEAVAVSSGTAALHAAMHALALGPGDEVIVPTWTFAATANCVRYVGAQPVFADVDAATLLIDAAAVEALITPRTRAVIAADYAGQPCDYERLRAVAQRHGLALVADACHSLGAHDRGRPVGTLADLNVFSLHAIKPITTGEGGMVTTSDAGLAARMRRFRNHGIDSTPRGREASGGWRYDMPELGYNYRLTDFQSALGLSQLARLPEWTARRQEIAARYDQAFRWWPGVRPLARRWRTSHAYHLYVVRCAGAPRDQVVSMLRADGIGVNVHYKPVHLHTYYRENAGTSPGMCPVAEAAYRRVMSLPIFPRMTDADVERVIDRVQECAYGKQPSVAVT